MSHAPLTTSDWQRINAALIRAFPTVPALRHFTRTRVAADLDPQIHWDAALALVAGDLAHVAHAAGHLPALLTALADDRPRVPELRQLAADLAPRAVYTPPPRPRADYYAHITLPPNYVPRPELLAAARALLLQPGEVIALTSAIQIDALHGMGGIGKTVLARALCDDPAVQAAFPDGILWATLGQTPDLLARLRAWIDALGGQITDTAPTVERLHATLATLLRNRACLLILDDVWRKEHALTLAAGGSACRVLLTTRDAALVEDLAGRAHPVPVMTEPQALDLLNEWASGARTAAPADLTRQIARRVGYLPLALKLAGAQLRRTPPAQWLASFDATRLATRRPESIHDSLKATFDLSLDDLTPAERAAYTALAIFKEDEPLPAVAAIKLWAGLDGRDANAARLLLDDLAARALVQGETPAYAGERVLIHDLLRDFMAAEQGASGLRNAHTALLAAYRATQTGSAWPTAPDDGYLYDHLAYHLAAAPDELSTLFADPHWLHARLERCARETDRYLYDGYLADLQQAWDRVHAEAHRQIDAEEEPSAIAECIRYALIRTSVNSLAANYVPELVARAVEVGLWSARRALSMAARVPDPEQRAQLYTLCLALPNLSLAERITAMKEGLAAVHAIGDVRLRAQALAALVPQLSGDDRAHALAQGLQDALAREDERDRMWTLAALAPLLDGELLEQGLQAALVLKDEEDRAQALAALVPQLSGEARELTLAQGLQAALAIEYEPGRAQALAALAPQLSGEAHADAVAQVLQAAHDIEVEPFRAWALAALAPQLSGEARAQALAQGVQAARAIWDDRDRAQALAALAPQLSGEARAQALQAALNIEHKPSRVQVLAALAPQLNGEQRAQALAQGLQTAISIMHLALRAKALAALAPELSGELLAQGLQAALAIKNGKYRAQALAALVPQLRGEAREQALAQGLQDALAIKDKWFREQELAVRALQPRDEAREQARVPQLSVELLAQEPRWQPRMRRRRAKVPQLSVELLAQELQATLTFKDERDRAQLLAELAPWLSGELRTQGLQAARAILYEGSRARTLAAFVRKDQESQHLIPLIRRALLDHIDCNLSQHTRADLFLFCSNDNSSKPPIRSPIRRPILPRATLATIAHHITDIRSWQWL